MQLAYGGIFLLGRGESLFKELDLRALEYVRVESAAWKRQPNLSCGARYAERNHTSIIVPSPYASMTGSRFSGA